MDSIPVLRRCTKCGEEKLLTSEFFRASKNDKHGFNPICKLCIKLSDAIYRANNTIKITERNVAYRNNNPEKIKAAKDKYAQVHKDRISLEKAQYRIVNAEKIRADKERYYQQNKERIIASTNEYRRKHPEVKKLAKIKRRHREYDFPNTLTRQEWQYAFEYFGYKCAVCERPLSNENENYTIAPDHWIPLANPNCPGTIAANIVPLCNGKNGCNSRKRHKDANEWLLGIYDAEEANIIMERIQSYFDSL